jgi:hypothetical protein
MNQKALSIKLRLRPEHGVCIHHKIISQKPYFRNFINVLKYYLDRTETERTLVSNKKVDIQSSKDNNRAFFVIYKTHQHK